MERNPVYGAGPQPPTAATGGDGVVVLENPAYSLPRDLQPPPGPQPPTATTGGDGVVVSENPAYSLPTDLQPSPDPQPPTATTVGGDGQQNNDGEHEPLN